MTERYLISGTQLGTITTALQSRRIITVKQVLNEIFDNQFIGHSTNNIKHDSERLSKLYPQTKDKALETGDNK
jgi:hypothetical protein